MLKTIKTITLFAILTFSISSCISPVGDDVDARTPELEQVEISNAIAKLETAGYDIDTTASGLFYILHTAGTGVFPQMGDTCYIEYAGYFINSVLFDTSQNHYTDGIWEFIYKAQPLIPGFDEAISMLNKGAEMDFIMPSNLAYGAFGSASIPPYSPLIFSIKLHNLKPKQE